MSGIIATVKPHAQWVASKGETYLDSVVSPQTRIDIWHKIREFIKKNPNASSWLAINLLFSGLPIALFLAFVGTVFTVVFVTAFAAFAFCFSLAMAFLLPTLFVTTIVATSFWSMAVLAFWLLFGNSSEKSTKRKPVDIKISASFGQANKPSVNGNSHKTITDSTTDSEPHTNGAAGFHESPSDDTSKPESKGQLKAITSNISADPLGTDQKPSQDNQNSLLMPLDDENANSRGAKIDSNGRGLE